MMLPANPAFQFVAGALRAPAALRLLRVRSGLLLLVYLAACSGLLGSVVWLVHRHGEGLYGLLLDYLFPTDWHTAARLLGDRFVVVQAQPILRNMLVGASLMVCSLLLFWLKEALSATFEKDAGLKRAPHEEFPLWMQALEEVKLLVLYVTAQMLLVRLGYPPDEERRAWAQGLSHLFLACTFALDFIAPVLQRHGQKYSTVVRVLARRPIAALSFGAVFAAPGVIAVAWARAQTDWSDTKILAVSFGAQVILIAWAAVAGTALGAELVPLAKQTKAPPVALRTVAWLALLGTFAHEARIFGGLGLAVHHKSQVLKCSYDLDWRSIRFETPSLGSLLSGVVSVGARVDLEIVNPTAFDLVLEDSRLQVDHTGRNVANTVVDHLQAPARGKAKQTLHFTLKLNAIEVARRGTDLLDDKYSLTLWIQVAEDFEWPIYLRLAP